MNNYRGTHARSLARSLTHSLVLGTQFTVSAYEPRRHVVMGKYGVWKYLGQLSSLSDSFSLLIEDYYYPTKTHS